VEVLRRSAILNPRHHERDVDVCTELSAFLREHIGNRTAGLVFCDSDGDQLSQRDILKYSLHPILKKLGHVRGGLNIFRRFRITELEKADCPPALEHFWSGHAQTHVSERYKKLLQERDYRLEWAEKIGMRFELPKRSIGNRGKTSLKKCGREASIIAAYLLIVIFGQFDSAGPDCNSRVGEFSLAMVFERGSGNRNCISSLLSLVGGRRYPAQLIPRSANSNCQKC
jgi:hypothetical protein